MKTEEKIRRLTAGFRAVRITWAHIYVLCCIKDPSLSNIKKYPPSDYCVQCHSGTIRNFVECKSLIFLFSK